jgi:hypothetical protein
VTVLGFARKNSSWYVVERFTNQCKTKSIGFCPINLFTMNSNFRGNKPTEPLKIYWENVKIHLDPKIPIFSSRFITALDKKERKLTKWLRVTPSMTVDEVEEKLQSKLIQGTVKAKAVLELLRVICFHICTFFFFLLKFTFLKGRMPLESSLCS